MKKLSEEQNLHLVAEYFNFKINVMLLYIRKTFCDYTPAGIAQFNYFFDPSETSD
jgi:hypothetical protein